MQLLEILSAQHSQFAAAACGVRGRACGAGRRGIVSAGWEGWGTQICNCFAVVFSVFFLLYATVLEACDYSTMCRGPSGNTQFTSVTVSGYLFSKVFT
jgi:hypothetical protein